MRAVWTYTMVDPTTSFPMPVGAKVLTAAEQYGGVCIWAEIDPNAPLESRWFQVVGTGRGEITDGMVYVGTAMLDGGSLVLHVYETTA